MGRPQRMLRQQPRKLQRRDPRRLSSSGLMKVGRAFEGWLAGIRIHRAVFSEQTTALPREVFPMRLRSFAHLVAGVLRAPGGAAETQAVSGAAAAGHFSR